MSSFLNVFAKFGLIFLLFFGGAGILATSAHAESNLQVVESFTKDAGGEGVVSVATRKKEKIMFIMGIPLLIMLLTTAALGIAMGVFGKKVFVVHMVLASLSLCLAVVHAIVGLVWFYPF